MKRLNFHFIENAKDIDNNNNTCFVIINGNNFSKADLLNEYYTKFEFPYFGFNWDALEDCLRDLYWIDKKNIIVYNEVLTQLNAKDLEIYLEILRDIVAHWKKYEEHDLEVYFNLKDYDKVQQFIK